MLENNSLNELKLDISYLELSDKMYSTVYPSSVEKPELKLLNEKLANDLGIDIEYLKSNDGVDVLVGNKILSDTTPIAQAYAGHQYGHFTMLGDGRALLLGEKITPNGDRFDIQLKGSGQTPYSRRGDGKATLSSMLREYIISEAMHGLGIPTTRSLTVITTGEKVIREIVNDGAVLSRIASSHIRVGTFEYAANYCSTTEVKELADYTINRHYPNISNDENKYLSLLGEVIKKQVSLIVEWMSVGFVHGVMNTDNMTISGETIDYGPCAFMDNYDLTTCFSSIDRHGRYAYGNQPNIGLWNLSRLAETLIPIIDEDKDKALKLVIEELNKYNDIFEKKWFLKMRAKLGLFNEEDKDKELINRFLELMSKNKLDYTNTFRLLTLNIFNQQDFYKIEDFNKWYKDWEERLDRQDESKEQSLLLMKENNPNIIPRNFRVEGAIKDAVILNDYKKLNKLVEVLNNPYAYTQEQEIYSEVFDDNIPYVTYCGT